MWFRTFSEQIKAKGLVDAHDSAAERFYYSTGGTILRDAYHGAVRKCDIILTRKLDSKSHGYAIGNAVDLPLPPDPTIRDAASNGATSNKCARSWKDVLVVGELKANFNEDVSKGIILQLGSYARETFCAQPGRRFVNAFTVCGHLARFYFFDRVGVLISTCYDISSKQGQELFMHGLLTYMKMTATELGFDDRYKDIEGNTFLPNNNEPVYLHLEGKTFKLMTTLHRTPAIVSRGTLCWLAREGKCLEEGSTCTNGCKLCLCVIKEAWRDTKLTAESELWKLAKEKNVYGCLDVLVACDADVVSREVIGHNPNNIRNMFDYTGAKPILQGISPDVVDNTGTRLRKNSTALETIHSESKITNQPLSERTKMTKKKPKKRLSSEHTGVNEFPLSKKSKKCGADVVEARTRSFLVVQNVGEKLHRSLQPVELVEALRDAIKCHRSLYEDAGILHCDISVQNIMRTRTPIARASGPKGFLIDLDYAQQQYPNSEQSFCMTGTAPFIALELLLKPQVHHTWRHDLESFLYVLIWLCTDNPYEKLSAWVKGLEHKDFAMAKFTYITSTEFFEDVLNGFHVRFEPLKELSLAFKEILFKDSKMTTPAGDESRKDIYNKVIQIFDDCVVKLESTQTLEKKEPKELSGHHDKGVEAGNEDWEYVERGTGKNVE
ncbi:hypothetical protein L211DRAFT_782201 [Terfezia boudieri ATCC MYA-4762]|uniref:Fungal-type protein kinase domain-containing protein n=1 Tax=Terfezia boudieri ATCC MYA-4762 TaxID=1051890 RepID=A0A3N4M6P3_9PEZI|nr:hypothetical protein L211DRAFT_782201 [Terfezia boudieri ATCC MYA-4762]